MLSPGDHWEDQHFISVTCGPFWHICVKIKYHESNGSRKDNVYCKCILCKSLGRRNSHNHHYKGEPSLLWKSSSFQIFPKRCITYTGMCQVRLNVFQIQAQKCFCLLSWTMVQKISKWLPLQRNPFLQKFLSFIQGEFVWKCSRDSVSLCSQSGPFSPKLVHYLCTISLHLDSLIPPAHSRTFNPFCK